MRRGRPALWVKWGLPHGINAGDAIFTLANLAMLRLEEVSNPMVTLHAARVLHQTSLLLTQGQYLDLEYEKRDEISLDDYQPMIERKTAALLSASTKLGPLVAGAGDRKTAYYGEFGRSLGLAFQIQDDLLGIWGDQAKTGKSNQSDLITGKKSLPVLFGLAQNGEFARRWRRGSIQPDELDRLADQLETEGAQRYAQERASEFTQEALTALQRAEPVGEAGQALHSLTLQLLGRED
jgi:geranylgeranyl diphosphate synthase type I